GQMLGNGTGPPANVPLRSALMPFSKFDLPNFDRRQTVRMLGATATIFLAGGMAASASGEDSVLTPEMFGARGDGRTDDYAALQRLAAAINRMGGGTVRFGRGRRYLIDQFL